MSALTTFLTRLVVTALALATVLLVFVVEPVMDPRGGASVLLLDRGRKARIGDRVVCMQKRATPLVARVAGVAGQRVALKGNLLFVEGEPVERRPCRGDESRAFSKALAPRCFVERRGDRSWSVLAPPDGRQVDLDVRVPSASVYLLSDDRAAALTDSRGTGPRLREECRSVAVEVSMDGVRYRP